MRRLLLTVLLFATSIVAWRGYVALSEPSTGILPRVGVAPAPPFEPTLAHVELPPPRSVLEVRPEEMLSVVRSGYQALPDRRFLLALAHAHHLITGAPAAEVESTFTGGRWVVRYGDAEVGALPDLADFDDATRLLRAWVRTAATDQPAPTPGVPEDERRHVEYVRARLESLEVEEIAQAMLRLDSRWRDGATHGGALRLAARGLTFLTLQSHDRLQIGDALPARALAALAMAQELAGSPMVEEEALLAHRMGYTAHARRVVRALDGDHPVRLFVDDERHALRALALSDEATPLARQLYELRLVNGQNPTTARNWIDRQGEEGTVFGLRQLRPLLAMGRFESDAELAALVPYVALYDLWKVGLPHESFGRLVDGRIANAELDDLATVGRLLREGRGLREGTLAQRFEADLVLLDARFGGPFLDGATMGAYFSGHFYSGLWQLARFVLDGLASPPQARELVVALEGAPSGVAAELARWYANLADASSGAPNTDALLRDLDELRHLGEPALRRTYDEVERHSLSGSETHHEVAGRLARRLDARVDNRGTLADLARDVYDLRGREELRRSLVRAAPDRWGTALRLMRDDGDHRSLLRFVEDPEEQLRYRVYGFELLGDPELFDDDARLTLLGRSLVDESPRYWNARTTYIDFLEARGRLQEAAEVAEEWLEEHGRRPDDRRNAEARTTLARLLHARGENEEAWRWIEPLAEGDEPDAVGIAARVLQDLGREGEALETAQRLAARYPTLPRVRAVLAEVLWKHGRARDVVPVLEQPGHPLLTWEWRTLVGPAFAAAFRTKPEAEAVAAYRILLEGRTPLWKLDALAVGVGREGREELAFTLQATLPTSGSWESLEYPLYAYQTLERLRGQRAALEWLRPRVPRRQVLPFAQLAYGARQHELLWTVLEDPDATRYPHFGWLLRAAAHVEDPSGGGARERALQSHFREVAADDYYALGAFLMDMYPEESVLALARRPDRRCEISYYLGVKAESEGRLEDAVDWYRVALETGLWREGEYHWASDRLDDLSDRTLRAWAADSGSPPG